mgnify:CR=1 FL=1
MSNTQSSSPTLDTVLYINDVSVYHKHEPLLKQIHLKIEKGSFHCLIGESGSGKSTLSRMILGIEKPDKGQVTLFNQPVHIKKVRRHQIAAVFRLYIVASSLSHS